MPQNIPSFQDFLAQRKQEEVRQPSPVPSFDEFLKMRGGVQPPELPTPEPAETEGPSTWDTVRTGALGGTLRAEKVIRSLRTKFREPFARGLTADEDSELAREYGLPPVSATLDQMSDDAKDYTAKQLIELNRVPDAGDLRDLERAKAALAKKRQAEAEYEAPEMADGEALLTSLRRRLKTSEAGYRLNLGQLRDLPDDVLNEVQRETKKLRQEARSIEIARVHKDMESLPAPAAMQLFQDVETLEELGALLMDEPKLIAHLMVENADQIVATALMSLVSPAAAGLTGFGMGMSLESGAQMLQDLAEEGVILTDSNSVQAALADPELMSRVEGRGYTKASVIALSDMIGGVLASKIGRVGMQGVRSAFTRAAQTTKRGLVGAGIGAVAGGAGEVAGSAAIGEEATLSDVAAEVIAGGGIGVGSAVAGGIAEANRRPTLSEFNVDPDAAIQAATGEDGLVRLRSLPIEIERIVATHYPDALQTKGARRIEPSIIRSVIAPPAADVTQQTAETAAETVLKAQSPDEIVKVFEDFTAQAEIAQTPAPEPTPTIGRPDTSLRPAPTPGVDPFATMAKEALGRIQAPVRPPTAQGEPTIDGARLEVETSIGRSGMDAIQAQDWAIMEAGNPMGNRISDEENAQLLDQLKQDLDAMGLEWEPTVGRYGEINDGVLIKGITEDQAVELGKKYQQDSVLTHKGLVYHDGTINPATGAAESFKPGAEDDYYTILPQTGEAFRIPIDFDTKVDREEMVDLSHWSTTKGLPEIDPGFQGTGAAGKERKRAGAEYLPRSYYGMPNYTPEKDIGVAQRAKARYKTRVPKRKLYNKAEDPDNIWGKVKERAAAREEQILNEKGYRLTQPVTATEFEQVVKESGYLGYYVDDIAAIFEKLPVEEVPLSYDSLESRIKGPDNTVLAISPAAPRKPLTLKEAEISINRVFKGWSIVGEGEAQIGLRVIESQKDMPEKLQAKLKKRGQQARVRAWFDPDAREVVFVADAFESREALVRTGLHEIALHAGLRRLMGGKLDGLLGEVADAFPDQVKRIARRYKLDLDNNAHRLEAAEEYLAELAESNPTQNFVQRAVAMVRNWIRSRFMGLKMTDNDALYIVGAARRAAKEGVVREFSSIRRAYPGLKETAKSDALMAAEPLGYKVRTKPAPKKTRKAYKAFRIVDGRPYPMFVGAGNALPVGQWLDATEGGYHFTGKNGREYVPTSNGKGGSTVAFNDPSVRDDLIAMGYLPPGSRATSIIAVAYRPGWHGGDLPIFPQSGRLIRKLPPDLQSKLPKGHPYDNAHLENTLIAEVELANDVDYQQEFEDTAERFKDGSINHKQSGLRRIPEDGSYVYPTNMVFQNRPDLGNWYIGGSLKINRILTRSETNAILDSQGLPRQYWIDEVESDNFSPRLAIDDDTFSPFGESRVSTVKPTAVQKNREFDILQEERQVGIDLMREAETLFSKGKREGNVERMAAEGRAPGDGDYVPILTKQERTLPAEEQLEIYTQRAAENLVWLYDKFKSTWPRLIEKATHWYVGGSNIAKAWAKRYGKTTEQVCAMMAVLSPQKDWYQNLSQAQRIADILSTNQNHRWDADMDAAMDGKVWPKADPSNTKKYNTEEKLEAARIYNEDREALRGKTLAELNSNQLKGMWIRVYDETYHDPGFNAIEPDGGILGPVNTDAGAAAEHGWGSLGEIVKATSIWYDGSWENINEQLGNEHKVRSFYNNLVAPNSLAGDVTMDTHAVAAAMLQPFSAKSYPVLQNIGVGMSNSKYGIRGSYGINADAYRRAARIIAERDGAPILPRAVQSVTWEAVRAMFKRSVKAVGGYDSVYTIWRDFADGKLEISDVREQTFAVAGGLSPPTWSESGAPASASQPPGSDTYSRDPGLSGRSKWARLRDDKAAKAERKSRRGERARLSLAADIPGTESRVVRDSPATAKKVKQVRGWVGQDAEVVATVADLPFDAPANTRGAAWRGRAYVVAENIGSKAEARDVVAHEIVGHLKAEQVPEYAETLRAIMVESDRMGAVKEQWDRAVKQRPNATPDTIAREVIAQMAEAESRHPIIRKLVSAYRAILRALGVQSPADSRVYALIAKAYRETNVTNDNVPWFSLTSQQMTTRDQADKGKGYDFQVKFQDDTRPIREIERLTGIEGVSQEVKLERSYRVYRVEEERKNYLEPLMKAIDASRFKESVIANWLHARHAEEANYSLRRRNIKRMIKEGALDEAALNGVAIEDLTPDDMDLIGPEITDPYFQELWEAPSGMTDADAQGILAQFVNIPAMQEIGLLVDRISARKLEIMYDSGLINGERKAEFENAYKHYVPLLRDIATSDEAPAVGGKGRGQSGKPYRIRKGSTKAVSQVLENLTNEFLRTSIQGIQNELFTQFHDQIWAHPSRFFRIDQKKEQVVLDAAGNIMTREALETSPNFAIIGYINGERTTIVAADDSVVAQDVVRVWNRIGGDAANVVIKVARRIMKPLAMLYTGYNPDFLFANPVRDIQAALFNITGKEAGGSVVPRAKMVSNWLMAIPELVSHEILGTGGRFSTLYEEAKREGGAMDWLEVYPVDADKTYKAVRNKHKRLTWASPLHYIEALGRGLENATRIVVYDTMKTALIKAGVPEAKARKQAAVGMREMTTDFLARGEWTQGLGAYQMFFNPSIQSTAKSLQVIRDNPVSRAMAFTGAVALFAVLDMAMREWSDDDDDDGIKNYDEPSIEYEKSRNVLFATTTTDDGKQQFLALPVPYFYDILPALGRIIAGYVSDPVKPIKDVNSTVESRHLDNALEILEMISRSINPFHADTQLQMLSPTLADFFVQVGENKTPFGTPLRPEVNVYDPKLEHERYFKSSRPELISAGKAVHEFLGGDGVEYGINAYAMEWIENPEVLDLLGSTVGGGLWTTFWNLKQGADLKAEGEEVPVNRVPVKRRFVKENRDDRDAQSKYFPIASRMDKLITRYDTGSAQERKTLRDDNPELKLRMAYETTKKEVQRMRRAAKDLEGEKLKAAEARIQERQMEFVRAFNRATSQ